MLEVTIKELEKDANKYAINAEGVGEVEDMKLSYQSQTPSVRL